MVRNRKREGERAKEWVERKERQRKTEKVRERKT